MSQAFESVCLLGETGVGAGFGVGFGVEFILGAGVEIVLGVEIGAGVGVGAEVVAGTDFDADAVGEFFCACIFFTSSKLIRAVEPSGFLTKTVGCN
ncbi:MAG: hypothetical protein COU31_04915 [Candidatus Magasanikbacteria bacterium CG10_big_fil_rev_8_21_14_0_10_40_10]|uniref:Uncharacterized protein n=1 Tax=Candidatus Magasanikbacteria bacterium CG10_big_fil_rev_8_21_14_0_10_40_10 TaxID=1974648 RepID=A0A2M6W2X7_9BACT|nr:MAG: hypothetical protein COU31_04915 [Candidatus Magasanikbacteria bacterium CG10_big_fil_rev_8_21_14_0_10_40_10]